MTRWSFFWVALGFAAGLHGQPVPGMYNTTPREFRNGVCINNDCVWTPAHLLTYYGFALDDGGLRRALRDRRADVRSMAADQLATKGAKAAVPWLAEALRSESVVGTRLYLAKALAQFGDERGVAALEDLCKTRGQADPAAEAFARLYAAQFLRPIRNRACNNCTVDLLRSLDRAGAPYEGGLRVGSMALAATLESVTADQASAIREVAGHWISDQDEYVRRQASAALALWGDARSFQTLKTALATEQDATARGVMQVALGQLEARLQSTPAN